MQWRRLFRWRRCIVTVALGATAWAGAAGHTLSVGIVPQRSATLTAQYWNPILNHVSARSGVALELKVVSTALEHTEMIRRGDLDFAYTNHHLAPGNDGGGYQVFARPGGAAIRGEIVVLATSTIRSLDALQGEEVGFPSRTAFMGYRVPMEALVRAGIRVRPVFGSNQESVMGQLRAGRVVAAGVNSQVMRDFAQRERFEYRVLWQSEAYHNIPLVANRRVAPAQVAAVRAALLKMADDPQGSKILADSAELLKLDPPLGFVAADDRDYDNARSFLRASVLNGTNP